MSTPKQQYYENLADSLIDKFNLRGIEGYDCETKEEAKNKVLELMSEGDTVTNGGSETLKECGIIDAVKNGEYNYVDRSVAESKEEAEE